MSEWRIPLADLDYDGREEQAALRVLRSRWLSMGSEVEAFERDFAEFVGAHRALAVASGTAGLHLALMALGIGPGDEVIQPAMNFVAAANVTVAIGATPIFADIVDVTEPTIDPVHLESLIGPRTRAVVVMHYGGFLARLRDITRICQRHGIALIEDACHAIGASTDEGFPAGSVGDVGVFSFFSNKNLATGEGGMLVTGDRALAERVAHLRSHGMTSLTWDRHRGHASTYDVAQHGFNYRLDELHAALGREQLKKVRDGNQRRAALTLRYRQKLDALHNWHIPFSAVPPPASACHLMTLVAPDAATRDGVAAALRERRIQTSRHYPCITEFSAFERFARADVERSKAFGSRVITLPLYPGMGEAAVDEVSSAVMLSQGAMRQ
jgi:dTDP-4-amino-4,6-dideoxygalactose transaminase